MKDKIRNFICSNFLFEFNEEILDDTDLFKAGIIDSYGYLQMINFLQDEFGITFSDEDMLTNIMVSFNHIVDTVQLKSLKT